MRLLSLVLGTILIAPLGHARELPANEDAVRPIPVGSLAPVGTLDSLDGSTVDLARLFAAKPTILIFYRGGWCPFCNRHLAALADSELEFRKLGYQIVAISPDPVPVLDRTAVRQHLRYKLLSDRQLKVSAGYQVAYRTRLRMRRTTGPTGSTCRTFPAVRISG